MFGERLSRLEKILYVVVLLLALFSRFYILGDRAISHDESIHTKFSWNLYAGRGFQHNPMMHGPMLFELTALSYFVFGPSDFSARFFAALAGVALVLTPILFRKWLGKKGAFAGSLLLLISPSISYYSRYIRHDVFLLLTAVLWLWTVFKYLDEGKSRWLYWMAALFSLTYATKEASYFYTAIFCGLLALPFAWQVFKCRWKRPQLFKFFIMVLVFALLCGAIFVVSLSSAEVAHQDLDDAGNSRVANVSIPWWGRVALALAFIAFLGDLVLLYYGVGEETMAQIRLFDVLMATGTLVLPLGAAFLIKFVAGLDMGPVYEVVRTGNFASMDIWLLLAMFFVLLLTLVISGVLGVWWDKERWPIIAIIHYAIFFVLYSTIFTWAVGVLSGMVGGLAYWLAQQEVRRGGQPQYYYLLVGGLYEYLPLLLSFVGAGGAIAIFIKRVFGSPPEGQVSEDEGGVPQLDWVALTPFFLVGWTLLSWIGYTLAGERMPWLLVHIALPSIFLAAWAFDKLLDGLTWQDFVERRGFLAMLIFPLMVAALVVFGCSTRDFGAAMQGGIAAAGPTLAQLEPFGKLFGGFIGALAFGALFIWAVAKFDFSQVLRLTTLTLVVGLSLLTVRTMIMLNFINYDMATEFLVYAHGTPDIKVALQQIVDVSWRATGSSHDVKVAYGEDGSWPFYWYFDAHFPNTYFYGSAPSEESLLDCPVVLAGSPQRTVVEEILGDDYVAFDYKYLWWPIQDYYDLTWERIQNVFTDPLLRAAVWDIVWDRDYEAYALLKDSESPFTLQTWPYRKEFRLYVRRDLVQAGWGQNVGPDGLAIARPQATVIPDFYSAGEQVLMLESTAKLPGESAPRGLAVGADGTLYIADALNHRVWNVMPNGAVRNSWGIFGTNDGEFNEPWDIAVDAEGDLYVADTWNHRIQKFNAEGEHLLSWGTWFHGELGDPDGEGRFFGPRGVAVDAQGHVYVTDTGNKRVQVFDSEGTYLREFGGAGSDPGQLDEPVGIAVTADGKVLVVDTWNQRVQVFSAEGIFEEHWSIQSWESGNPEEKPYITTDEDGNVYVGDPVNQRVLVFSEDGVFAWSLGSTSSVVLSFPEGMAVVDGILYVADAYSGQVLGYRLP